MAFDLIFGWVARFLFLRRFCLPPRCDSRANVSERISAEHKRVPRGKINHERSETECMRKCDFGIRPLNHEFPHRGNFAARWMTARRYNPRDVGRTGLPHWWMNLPKSKVKLSQHPLIIYWYFDRIYFVPIALSCLVRVIRGSRCRPEGKAARGNCRGRTTQGKSWILFRNDIEMTARGRDEANRVWEWRSGRYPSFWMSEDRSVKWS